MPGTLLSALHSLFLETSPNSPITGFVLLTRDLPSVMQKTAEATGLQACLAPKSLPGIRSPPFRAQREGAAQGDCHRASTLSLGHILSNQLGRTAPQNDSRAAVKWAGPHPAPRSRVSSEQNGMRSLFWEKGNKTKPFNWSHLGSSGPGVGLEGAGWEAEPECKGEAALPAAGFRTGR